MKMKIIIPQQIKDSIATIGNTTKQRSALKIYAALFELQKKRTNNEGFFAVPSTYLEKINQRYYTIIQKFIKDDIIEYYEYTHKEPDLFNLDKVRKTKGYNVDLGICMKYRFKVDVSNGKEEVIDMDSNRQKNWYKITLNSLIQLGYKDIKIGRDSYGRRVHHNLTNNYKKELSNQGYSIIDAQCSQPRLLNYLMQSKGAYDENYSNIFDNNRDFYSYLISLDELGIKTRKQAKKLFTYWVGTQGRYSKIKNHYLFPEASKFIDSYKSVNYKDGNAFLQREESKIWIDDLLENLPVKFGLSIHDSLIVRDKDRDVVYEYCKQKYPQIIFEMREL